ncbi:hypothetical protein [Cognataquiflexum rubidum]|uniref:hypothetical protein n=1 Tax=Cognataquiflexum rubidum TaxID=2922273 RepID=UPI001F12EC77|nr:hypothetical protein [Cognataquiflexum rubidum]MCH6232725.1 hypothetical protein [Cognataquiflexum rubidum]
MKAFIATMILATGVSVNAMANSTGSEKSEKASVSLRQVDENKIQLVSALKEASTLTVKIFDENKFLVQKDRIVSEKSFSKNYDFSKLESGIYSLEVSENNVVIDQMVLDLTEVEKAPVVYSRLDKVEDNKYKLLVNALLPSDMSVMVFENDKLVYEEKIDDTIGFQKLFKFQHVNPGARVEFYVKSSDGFAQSLAAK